MIKKDDDYNYYLMVEFVLSSDDEKTQRYVTQVKVMTCNLGM